MVILVCAFLATIVAIEGSDPRVAVATLVPRSVGAHENILGSLTFTETDNGLQIRGIITGLPVGNYGFHVHELGDITSCDTSGAHFNPDETEHGGREHEIRHVGDLGNVAFVAVSADNVVATVDITDNVISLHGRNNILGRTLVLHEQEDDLGLGGHETSKVTGNAGARVACGVIGIKSPSDSWNAGVAISPSLFLFAVTLMAAYLRL